MFLRKSQNGRPPEGTTSQFSTGIRCRLACDGSRRRSRPGMLPGKSAMTLITSRQKPPGQLAKPYLAIGVAIGSQHDRSP